MKFEWDEKKNLSNQAKHGISFEEASKIFNGDYLTRIDNRFDYGEIRHISLGKTENKHVIIVVHTNREGNRRIISTRFASKKEREIYNTEFG